MSSAVYLKFKKAVPLGEWNEFCRLQDIQYSPNTIGWNMYYYKGDKFGVEIRFGDAVTYKTDDKAAQHPPASAKEITVSTFHMGEEIGTVAKVAKVIRARWKGRHTADLELQRLMKKAESA